jgi:hypothetical protein
MATDVEIVNQALVLLGEGLLSDLAGTDSATKSANAVLEISRRSFLRDAAPNFAHTWVALGDLTAESDNSLLPTHTNVFQLPDGHLLAVNLYRSQFSSGYGLEPDERWSLYGNRLGTEIAEGFYRYVGDNTAYDTEWDDLSIDAFSALLAWKLAYPLTESRQKAAEMRDLYSVLRTRAGTRSLQEGTREDWKAPGNLAQARHGRTRGLR